MIGGQQCWDLFSDISKNSNPPLPPRTKLNFGYHGWKWLLFLAKTLLGLGAGGDDRSKVENYRGIILLSALSKLFTSILNNRLYDYMVQKRILKAEQRGFRKMHETVDQLIASSQRLLISTWNLSQRKAPKFTLFMFRRLQKSLRLYNPTKTIRQTEKRRCPRMFPRRFNIHVLKW